MSQTPPVHVDPFVYELIEWVQTLPLADLRWAVATLQKMKVPVAAWLLNGAICARLNHLTDADRKRWTASGLSLQEISRRRARQQRRAHLKDATAPMRRVTSDDE